jgi:hypothetical protein
VPRGQGEEVKTKAVLAAAFLLIIGALGGVVIDRMVIIPHQQHARHLTVDALAAQLQLEPDVERRVRALVDSMFIEVANAAQHGPDSLRATARYAHERIEAALPPHARAQFRQWVNDHHDDLMSSMDRVRARHLPH